jgi:hypothetical protein
VARVRTRLPRVFVGHPFAGRFAVKKFRQIFKALPFNVIYGNTDLQTKHLLSIMKGNVSKADFSIFDLSDWNPNVALELGLAEGLKRHPAKNYYIVLNTRRSKEVPSDIRGMQRLEYTAYDFRPEVGLGDLLTRYILSKEYWVKRIWKDIPDTGNGAKMRTMALKVLAHFRDHDKLTRDNIATVARGTHLRQTDRDNVMETLRELKVLRKIKGTEAYSLARNLYG